MLSYPGGGPVVQIARRIAAARERAGLSRRELATRIDQSYWAVCKYEEGTRLPPSDVLGRIAQATNTTTDYLLGRTDDPGLAQVREKVAIWLDGPQDLSPEEKQELLKFVEWLKHRRGEAGPSKPSPQS